MKNLIIAVDGPAGSGKSTISKMIADMYNFTYIDTGAMYRILTLYLLENKISIEDEEKIKKALNKIKIDMNNNKFYLNGQDVTEEIRTEIINENVSNVARKKIIRDNMVALQRKIGEGKNCILDGRDIGTVVFPNAQIKIFLIASIEERARRRYNEFKEKNVDISFEEVLSSLKQRDLIDSTREESPLKKAADAYELDSTKMSIKEVLNFISEKIDNYKLKE